MGEWKHVGLQSLSSDEKALALMSSIIIAIDLKYTVYRPIYILLLITHPDVHAILYLEKQSRFGTGSYNI